MKIQCNWGNYRTDQEKQEWEHSVDRIHTEKYRHGTTKNQVTERKGAAFKEKQRRKWEEGDGGWVLNAISTTIC